MSISCNKLDPNESISFFFFSDIIVKKNSEIKIGFSVSKWD